MHPTLCTCLRWRKVPWRSHSHSVPAPSGKVATRVLPATLPFCLATSLGSSVPFREAGSPRVIRTVLHSRSWRGPRQGEGPRPWGRPASGGPTLEVVELQHDAICHFQSVPPSFYRPRRQWDGGLGPSRARLKWRLSAPRHDQASLRRLARARAQRRPKSQCDFLSNQRPLLYRLGL